MSTDRPSRLKLGRGDFAHRHPGHHDIGRGFQAGHRGHGDVHFVSGIEERDALAEIENQQRAQRQPDENKNPDLPLQSVNRSYN